MSNSPVVCVCVSYRDNSRFWDDTASGDYERDFDTKREAWNYIQTIARHAEAKPWMSVRVIVVDIQTHQHIWGDAWNWR